MKFLMVVFMYVQIAWNAQAGEVGMEYTQKIEKIFNELNYNNLDIVYDFYSSDTHFEDPIGSHEGVEAVKKYYAHQYKSVESIRFDFKGHVCQKNQCVSLWTMHLKTKSLNNGQAIAVEGNSVFKFNEQGKVTYHRDYFDMGAFVYERIPILKNIISFIKSKMRG